MQAIKKRHKIMEYYKLINLNICFSYLCAVCNQYYETIERATECLTGQQ